MPIQPEDEIPLEHVEIIREVLEEEDPYDQGWVAGYHDKGAENPYPVESSHHDEWERGYEDGHQNS